MARGRKRGYRQLVEADLDIMPLMNLFVVLIPMLLLSAVFVELSVLDLHLPSADAQAQAAEREALGLSVTIENNRYLVEGRKLRSNSIDRDDEDAEAQLRDALNAISSEHPDNAELTIVSPGNTEYQEIITVMDISHAAGLSAVSLMGQSLK